MYTVVRSHDFLNQIADLDDYEQASRLVQSIQWALERDPTSIGIRMPDPNVWCFKNMPTQTMPSFAVYWRIGVEQVTLLGIRKG